MKYSNGRFCFGTVLYTSSFDLPPSDHSSGGGARAPTKEFCKAYSNVTVKKAPTTGGGGGGGSNDLFVWWCCRIRQRQRRFSGRNIYVDATVYRGTTHPPRGSHIQHHDAEETTRRRLLTRTVFRGAWGNDIISTKISWGLHNVLLLVLKDD